MKKKNMLYSSYMPPDSSAVAAVNARNYALAHLPSCGYEVPYLENCVINSLPIAVAPQPYQVYPNPFREEITIENLNAPAQPIQIILHDIMGRQVLSRTENLSSQITISLPVSLPNGLYILILRSDTHTSTYKLIKQ